ncbi:hypothetical protein NDU88_007184 [Pleurodeles waltl]|uniref:Uncharacterized protein n=1 Tax=Pleurodeles waltl TaxID=8319 RepID=A0AAV7MFG2_PLEWA|nr:hypothetical protein NDU88_007184 [Pleurodeles waltl]
MTPQEPDNDKEPQVASEAFIEGKTPGSAVGQSAESTSMGAESMKPREGGSRWEALGPTMLQEERASTRCMRE